MFLVRVKTLAAELGLELARVQVGGALGDLTSSPVLVAVQQCCLCRGEVADCCEAEERQGEGGVTWSFPAPRHSSMYE